MTTSRGKAGIIITVFTVMAVLIAAGAVTTVLLVKRAQHKNDIKKADETAQKFDQDADAWKDETIEGLRGAGAIGSSGDYDEIVKIVKEQSESVPKPGSAPSYGKKHSSKYKQAKKSAATLTDGLDDVTSAAKAAANKTEWASEAFLILLENPTADLPTELSSSKKLRSKAIPAFKKQLKDFKALDAPDDAKKVDKAIRSALQYAIDDTTKLADRIDAQQNYHTRFAKKVNSARKKLDKYTDAIGTELKESIDEFDDTLSNDAA